MKLWIERLERRDLLTVLRIASWNTANNPDGASEDTNFETVFDAIGNESVQGVSTRIDLLALQETDTPSAGSNSIGRIESIFEGLYPGVDYGSAVSSLDGGGDATGFVYDTTTLSLLGTQEFSAGLTHTTLRGEFRPVGTAGDADFFVYTTHLKAGTSGSDESTRGSEAALLRSNADALGAGASVIMAGDFNIQDSFEPAYSNFLASGTSQFQDPINSPGNWHDNSAFRNIHTQNPADPASGGGGMDDRFDFQLLTGEFFDGLGIDYVDGSYRAFGNNGTHALNGSITTGTGASPTILQALANASDHLPVVADYEVVGGSPDVLIAESGGSTTVAEGGLIDTYTVTLTSVPTDNVTVTVTPDIQTDVGAGPGSSVSLVFTPTTATTGQTIIVSANDDSASEGTHTSTITHSSISNDVDFDGLAIADVVVTVLDNETPSIVINELDADTASTDTLEFIELYDGGVGNSSLDGLALVLYNGSTDVSYRAFDLDGFTTDGDGFFLIGNTDVTPTPSITFNNNTLQNGADAAALYFADADAFPNGSPVTVSNLLDAVVYDTNDADDPGLLALLASPTQPQVDEDENNSQTLESIARVPDGGNPRETTTYVAQAPTPGTFNAPPQVGVVINQSGGRTDVTEGGATDSYSLALISNPSSNVQITVTPDVQIDLGGGPGVAITLNFAPATGVIPQTVTVTATDDTVIEGLHTGLITHTATSADANYNNISIGNVIANVTDNEAVPQTNVVITEIMYNPDSDEASPGVAEWIEVVNRGNVPVDLGGWLIDDEDTSNWGAVPVGTTLGVGQVAVFFDEAFTSEATFRSSWSVPTAALVVGVSWGSLANSPSATSEILQLLDNGGQVQDTVNYDDSGDWPSDNPDGPSIFLTDLASDNDVGTNWSRSSLGTDNAVHPTGPFSSTDVGSPGYVDSPPATNGDFNDDGIYDCLDVDALVAEIVQGSTDLTFDLTGDGTIDNADLDAWLAEAGEANLGPGKVHLEGDANLDGVVDGIDFAIWNSSKFTFTPAWCNGDFDANGVVDGIDFAIWNSNKFTASAPPSDMEPKQVDNPQQREPINPAAAMDSMTDSTVGSAIVETNRPAAFRLNPLYQRSSRAAQLHDAVLADRAAIVDDTLSISFRGA